MAGSPQFFARSDPAGATGIFHLAPADRGDFPGTAVPGHRRIAPTGLPKEGAYPRSPDPRSRNPGRFCAGTPAPREGSFGPWPPEGGRDTLAALDHPLEMPSGRPNFGKEGATPSIRPCPRKPFARDPVQRGGRRGAYTPAWRRGDKWGVLLGDQRTIAWPSPLRGEGGAQRRLRGEASQRTLATLLPTERMLRDLTPHPSSATALTRLAPLALSPEGRGD